MNSTDMILNSTVTGASHLECSKECQDCSSTWQNRSGSIKIAVVSDGHGGGVYYKSALGAQLACKIAVDTLKEVALSIKRIHLGKEESILKLINRSILARWNEAIRNIKGPDPIISFGCTLIAYLQTPKYWLALQIGDGKFVILDSDGVWKQPIPWDDRCILNFTTSLCDESAIEEFRYATGTTLPHAVFLSSDGIDSTFEDGELLYNFYNQILVTASNDGINQLNSQLPEVLLHFSRVGSRDDMSLAVIIRKK